MQRENITTLSVVALEERVTARVREAERLPPGEARQHALKNAAQLRSYAETKRLMAPEQAKPGAKVKG
jgi:hypothetical protein